ncbi:MAG: hypothetical protein R2685_07915 [Candidatus Nitrosocosmicus sp.]|jgi:hypothetical protein|nr:hypothetical protein [Candidatus Nitrosocosmicus sp.]
MSAGDFKVIDINDAGLPNKFGGDDLDKINRILNGEDLSLDILIDNEWSFKHNKLEIRDFTGDNKIRIGTSEEVADWSITIPTLGGNRTPVFEDLEQTLKSKNIDADDNTITNIGTDEISNSSITAAKLATNAVETAKIKDANVTVGKLASNSVTTVKIAEANVTDAKIDSVSWTKLTDVPDASTSIKGVVKLGNSSATSAGLVIQANDTRLSDSRDPNAHAASHGNGGTDEISIDWSQITSGIPTEFTPDDHTHDVADLTENIGSNGQILTVVSGSPAWANPDFGTIELDDLGDVDVTTVTPLDNYVLTYSSTAGGWIAAEPPGASGGEANTLTNVGGEKELVKTKVGVNYDIRTLKAGTNVTITQDTNTVTIAATDTNTVTDALADLTDDVSISSPSNLQVLAYNSSTSKWENNSFNAEKTGTATADGNGSSVEFVIGHDLGSVPSSHFIQCYSHSIPFTWEIDSSDFTVTFDEAPDSGTDNVKFTWRVVA